MGPEALIAEGVHAGAVGAVSGLAAALPEVVLDVVANGENVEARTHAAASLRNLVNEYPFQAALKSILAWRGVPIRPDVRAPLRGLDRREAAALRERLGALDERYVFES